MIGVMFSICTLFLTGGVYQLVTYRQRKLDTIILHDETYRDRSYTPFGQTTRLFQQLTDRLQGFSQLFLNERKKMALEKKLDQAGERKTPEVLVSEQLAGCLIGIIFGSIGFLAGGLGLLSMLFLGFLGFMRPQMALTRKWRERRKEMSNSLLSFVDVFALMLETGASIYSGMDKASRAVGGALGEEIQIMLRQSKSRGLSDALHQMSLRVNQQDIDGLVTILNQAGRYGAGMNIVHSLRQFSFAVRTNKRNDIDKQVQKVGIKILFPMFLFILMPMLAILFAPVMASFGRSGLF